MNTIDVSQLNPSLLSHEYRPYIDIAIRLNHWRNAPKDGRRIFAYSSYDKNWIPIYFDSEDKDWRRLDNESMWAKNNSSWDDYFICWIDLPTPEVKL